MSDPGGGASFTTDPAAGTSAATDVSLREYLTALINGVEERSDERFRHMKEMVETAFENAQTAITKADIATEKRFEGVNEFRAALSDQATQFVTRDAMVALADKIENQIDQHRKDMDGIIRRLDLREGQTQGSRITGGILVTVITVGVGVLGLLLVLATYLSGHH